MNENSKLMHNSTFEMIKKWHVTPNSFQSYNLKQKKKKKKKS